MSCSGVESLDGKANVLDFDDQVGEDKSPRLDSDAGALAMASERSAVTERRVGSRHRPGFSPNVANCGIKS